MPRKPSKQPDETAEKERVSNPKQTTVYCDPVLWQMAKAFVDAANDAKKGKPGPRPPKSASALVVELLTKHLAANGPKVGIHLPEEFHKKN